MHFSDLNIAYSELEIPYSFAILIPVGVNALGVWSIADELQLTSSLRSSIFSLGLRMIDLVEDVNEESPVRFLTLPSGANASVGLGLNYSITDWFSLQVGYELQLLRIRPWDSLLSASDNLLFGLTVGL